MGKGQIYNITKYRLSKSHHMTKCQEKRPAAQDKIAKEKKTLTMFAEIPWDKLLKSEAGDDQLKQKWPTLLTLPNPT